MVGFAAETDDLIGNALRKLLEKRLDLVVANHVGGEGSAFRSDDNQVTLVSVEQTEELPRMSKALLAEKILDRVVQLLGNPPAAREGSSSASLPEPAANFLRCSTCDKKRTLCFQSPRSP